MNNKSIINMMTLKTKRLFLIFVVGLIFAANSFAAQRYSDANGLQFLIDTQNITATLLQSTYTGNIVIPEKVTINNVDYPVVALGDSCFKNSKITSVSIPNSVKKLGATCFYKCYSLASIELPDSITELPDSCFYWANLRNGIKLPKKLEKIGKRCFSICSFTQIDFPSSLTEIGENAFWNCSNLTSIELPDNIKEISPYCFGACWSLTKVKLPSALESLEYGCFQSCKFESITLPNTLTRMNTTESIHSIGCFDGCSNLKEITIPRSLTYIPQDAFDGCTALETVNLNSNVTWIGAYAFYRCPKIQVINCYATEPPSYYGNAFSSEIFTNCILNVPEESKAKYTSHDAWKKFNIYTLDTPEPGVDVLTASITDAKPNIPEGTYYAGNLTYTRTGEYVKAGKYVAQCLPFDINLAETKCFTDVFIPMNIALCNTETKLLTLMLDKADMTSVIKAGQPFLAKLAEDKVEVKNCNSTYISDDYANQDIETEFKVYDTTGESGVLQRNYNLDVRLGGTYQYKDGLNDNVYKTFMSTGQFGGSDHVLPFRAYVYKANAAAQAAVQSISWGIGDETTGIKYIVIPETKVKDNKVFTLDGKLVNQTGDTKSLKKGIYIINGRKIIIK